MFRIAMLAAAAVAQTPAPCPSDQPGCNDLGGARQREQLKVDALPALAAADVQIIRIFTADGFGGRFAAISYVRRPGEEPAIEIAAGGPRPSLSMPISAEAWDQALLEVANFDASPAPRAGAVPFPPCLHPWQARIEVVDRRYTGAPPRVRAKSQLQCEDGSTYAIALLLTQQAKKLIPSCALLEDRFGFGSAASLLTFCAAMKGDKAAVAQAHNVFRSPWLENPLNEGVGEFLAHHFDDQALLSWPGEPPVHGMTEVAARWATKFSKLLIAPRAWTGVDDHQVLIEGVIYDGTIGQQEDALPHFKLLMTKENGFDFRIREMLVTSGRDGA